MYNNRTTFDDQHLYINNYEVSGVIGVKGNFDTQYQNINIIGNKLLTTFEGNSSRKFSITRQLINSDPLKSFITSESPVSGFVSYNSKSYGFEKGYITNYSASCSVGETVKIETQFEVYGNIGGGITTSINTPVSNYIYVPSYGGINISANEWTSNRILSFTYTAKPERIAAYGLGVGIKPIECFLKKPIELELSFEIGLDDYETSNIDSLICSPNTQNITVYLKSCNGTTIESFTLTNATLVSNSYQSSIDSEATINLTFKAYQM